MHADLSRWTFRPEQHYSRVVVQQGRVSLDADANAEASILLHYMRALAADLIGVFGGPRDDLGFVITIPSGTNPQSEPTLSISLGHYYVNGLLCEADAPAPGATSIDYFGQPDGYGGLPNLPTVSYLVWLKVWERFISAVEDPDLREIALGLNGPDTTGRTRVVWQVLATEWPAGVTQPENVSQFYSQDGAWSQIQSELSDLPTGTLMAQAVQPQVSTDACTLSPSSGYRGPENQLYRVEIHRGGTAEVTTTSAAAPSIAEVRPTFMWSRDNGSVILPITGISPVTGNGGALVSVTTLGRDPKLSVDVGNYVEIVDDASASQGQPGPIPGYGEPLHLVTAVDPVNLTVTLDQAPVSKVGQNPALHPYLRRWDQDEVLVTKAGLTIDSDDQAIDIVVTTAGQWIDLEDGVQVQFSPGTYRAGDYWEIPARVVTGDVEWPADPESGGPAALPPMGVRYYLAPLAFVAGPGSVPIGLQPSFLPATDISVPMTQAPAPPTSEARAPASRSSGARTPGARTSGARASASRTSTSRTSGARTSASPAPKTPRTRRTSS